jgi:hypothetical protein
MYESAQLGQKEARLLDARRDFRGCAVTACPELVRRDCTEALADLEKKLPSVKLTARGAGGTPLSSYELEIDGHDVVPSKEPLELDPGEHVFVFRAPDGTELERRVTLRPGDTGVPVIAELAPPRSKQTQPRDKPPRSGLPTASYVLGGIALVGLAGFVGFGLAGKSTAKCEGSCSDAQVDTIHKQYLFADIGLVVAVVSGGAATWLSF